MYTPVLVYSRLSITLYYLLQPVEKPILTPFLGLVYIMELIRIIEVEALRGQRRDRKVGRDSDNASRLTTSKYYEDAPMPTSYLPYHYIIICPPGLPS